MLTVDCTLIVDDTFTVDGCWGFCRAEGLGGLAGLGPSGLLMLALLPWLLAWLLMLFTSSSTVTLQHAMP